MLLLLVVVVAGCDSTVGPVADIEKVAPVSGTLTYKGKAIEGYQVTLYPADGRRVATGVTDAQGKFTMGTNRPGDGAPPGIHKVSVMWVGPGSTDAAGQEQIIDNPALLPKPPVKLPAKYGNPDTSALTQEVPKEGLKDLAIDLK